MDEAKSVPDRVVTASKKAEKGTKWRLQSRNMDSDGSEMELRQGKRVKATGVFDRHAQDFTMSNTKKNKVDWKAKRTTYDDPKDIMKTVKESKSNSLVYPRTSVNQHLNKFYEGPQKPAVTKIVKPKKTKNK